MAEELQILGWHSWLALALAHIGGPPHEILPHIEHAVLLQPQAVRLVLPVHQGLDVLACSDKELKFSKGGPAKQERPAGAMRHSILAE